MRRANQRIRPDDGNHSSSAVLSQPVSNFLVLFQPFSVLRCRAVERETSLEDANDVNDSDAVYKQQALKDIEADCGAHAGGIVRHSFASVTSRAGADESLMSL